MENADIELALKMVRSDLASFHSSDRQGAERQYYKGRIAGALMALSTSERLTKKAGDMLLREIN